MTGFDIVLADPPWRYAFSRSANRKIERHYDTLTIDRIRELAVPSSKDCVLFLWATSPKLPDAMSVLEAWGFTYKTSAVWDKVRIGMGYWFRGQHELLLVGTKGSPSPPQASVRVSSVFRSARQAHSQKPTEVQDWIDRAYPDKTKVELFARCRRPGWSAWGNEVASDVVLDL